MVLFTSVAVTFIPPQLVSGLFGMNVKVPFFDGFEEELQDKNLSFWEKIFPYVPFISIVLCSILFASTLLCIFKTKKII